ncbi:hypothetical protein CHUAL_006704 [Chamberlinius hualienensis]
MTFFALIILITTYIQFVFAQQSPTCNGDAHGNVYDFVNGVSSCIFPYYNVTSDAVRDHCPQLTTESLCPFNADKSLNKINIEKTVAIVNDCLKQPKFGNIELNRITFPPVTCIVDEIVQGFGLTGKCGISQHTSFFDNMNNTHITVTDTDSQDNVNISIILNNFVIQGIHSCKFTLPLIKTPIPMDNVSFYGIFDFTSKSSISLKDNNTSAEIQSSTVIFDAQLEFLKFKILEKIPLESIFSQFFNEIMGKTKISQIFAKFIAAIVSGALQFTKTQCN